MELALSSIEGFVSIVSFVICTLFPEDNGSSAPTYKKIRINSWYSVSSSNGVIYQISNFIERDLIVHFLPPKADVEGLDLETEMVRQMLTSML